MILTPQQIADYTQADIVVAPRDAERCACAITWDSREVQSGYAYVALPGERVDGHSFVGDALRAGACVVLVMQQPDEATCALARDKGAALLKVDSTHKAFIDIARGWRRHLKGKVIALTGSTGKTTTKNLVRDVLATTYSVVATQANQNNELGVPRTLLAADPTTEVVVLEIGMRGLGQIAELCDVVCPDAGLITNVGESHIELLGSRENIARAKAELLCALPASTGSAFLNGADDMSDFMRKDSQWESSHGESICFDGTGNYDDRLSETDWRYRPAVWARDISLDEQGRAHFTLCYRGFSHNAASGAGDNIPEVLQCACQLTLRGRHNVENACAAAAVGLYMGCDIADIVTALEGSAPESGRQEIWSAPGGFTVMNDAYNANPDSMRASLMTFCALSISGRRYAVLGDMGELGDYAQASHEAVGSLVATLPLDIVITVGELARFIACAAQDAGYPSSQIVVCQTREEALAYLKEHLLADDAVLVKASHFMELDRIAKGLLN